MAGFADKIAAFVVEAETKANGVVRDSILEVGRRVISRSPVDTGRFASNWNYGLETPDTLATEQTSIRSLNNAEELPAKPVGFTHFVSNSLPYAWPLERGHSKQAPSGM